MVFTIVEMEMLCLFYSGTRQATIEIMTKAAGEMFGRLSGRREAVISAIEKLEQMRDGDMAGIPFE